MSLKSKKLLMDGRTDVRTSGRTFETHFLGRLGGVDLTTKRTRSLFQIRTHVQNAFGKITNAFARPTPHTGRREVCVYPVSGGVYVSMQAAAELGAAKSQTVVYN